MAGFLYYVPGRPAVTLEDARQAGLGYAFDENSGISCCGVSAGPDGGQGVIFAGEAKVPSDRTGYYPTKQQWRKIPGTQAWVGMYPADRPGPDDLAREDALGGRRLKLGDRNEWLVPVILAATRAGSDGFLSVCTLPRSAEIDEDGHWLRGAILPEYDAVWEAAAKWFDVKGKLAAHVLDGGDPAEFNDEVFDSDYIYRAAAAALAQNYLIGPAEISALRLLNDQAAVAILNTAIDEEGQLALAEAAAEEKKTDPVQPVSDGSDSASGPEAACPVTQPP